MQMFPDITSLGEMGESSECKHGVSEHDPTLLAAFSVSPSISAFRSLTVLADRNDNWKLSAKRPVSNFQLNAVSPPPPTALIGRCGGAGTRRLSALRSKPGPSGSR